MADSNNLVVMEERETTLVSPTNHSRTFFRKAHFLTPSISTPVKLPLPLPLPPPPGLSLEYKDLLPLQVSFPCWRHSTTKWETWVRNMKSLHHVKWKQAGIFDAIMSSTSIIHRDDALIYGFVERWCPVTNSFVFPWGEATVTLEDMLMIGGYSVLGDSVLISPIDRKSKETVEKLGVECFKMRKTKTGKASQSVWMKKFMDSGDEIEHEAFLAYWLSSFVFPMRTVGRCVLSIAVRLSRGVKIALAPAVLAEIYQSLSLLKVAMTTARKIGNGSGECDHDGLKVSVTAPLALVQVWIWERFRDLRLNPNSIGKNEARIMRWHNLRRIVDIQDLSLRMESFEWRPYAKATEISFHEKIYVDDECWALVDTDLDEEMEGWIRCLRTSELVGLDVYCIEQYLPHRVARQFGMDQDLPGYVARVNVSSQIAWNNYCRPIRDKKVYVPARLVKPGLTTRYLKWWNEICSEHSKVELSRDSIGKETEEQKDLIPSTSNGRNKAVLHRKRKHNFKSSNMVLTGSDSSAGVSPPGCNTTHLLDNSPMTHDNKFVMEERKESLVTPINHTRTFFRKAHFLTPSATSINTAIKAPPPPPPGFSLGYEDLPLKVSFPCWRHSTKAWEKWVDQMRALHHITWEKAGIFDAIMSSTSIIHRNNSLLFGFVERWCPVTNSFVFPWGEATVTLEDMIVLGGYSVLGDSVLITPKARKLERIVEKLVVGRIEMRRSREHGVNHSDWMKKFMESGSEIEHEAFLAYWLSRFVFPVRRVGRSVFSMAVCLSRGIKIALAPAVLAEIYQTLSLLKVAMTAARKIGNGGGECDSVLQVSVAAPLTLVQVWIWERFRDLRPNPRSIGESEPRIMRWHNMRKADIKDLSMRIDSAGEIFEWRPYMNHVESSFHGKIYLEDEYWPLVDTDLDVKFEGLIRCLRTSELVGQETGCMAQYLPHRVAMQFGMDQDLPGHVTRENASLEIAWSNYTRPISDKNLYVPPRFLEPGVTVRYLKWWKERNCIASDGKSSSYADSKVEVSNDSIGKETLSVPSTSNEIEADLHGHDILKSSEMIFIDSDSSDGVSPPDFSPNWKREREGSSGESSTYKRLKDGTNNIESVRLQVFQQTLSSTPNVAKSSKTIYGESSFSMKRVAQLSTNRESKADDVQESEVKNTTEKERNEQRKIGVETGDTECEFGASLEERILVLEKLCDLLRTGKLNHLLMKNPNK